MISTFHGFAKKLLGSSYDRLWKHAAALLVLYAAMSSLDIDYHVSLNVFMTAISVFTFGMVVRTLSSDDNRRKLKGAFMLPFRPSMFNAAYFLAIALYTLVTKTSYILVFYISVSLFTGMHALAFLLSFLNAGVTAFVVFALLNRGNRVPACLLMLLQAALCLLPEPFFRLTGLLISTILQGFVLHRTDAYRFYKDSRMKDSHSTPVRSSSFFRYIVRYLLSHKSYLYNTFALCIFAGFMAYMLEQMHLDSYLPLGFAVLSFNTPIGILLSSNRGLHRKIQMLPGQLERIVVPYGLFILAVNLFIYAIYLACWQLFHGSLEIMYYVLSVLFAAQCAISTVWLEWKHPVFRWKVESDLWHHSRKYAVPLIMCLLAVTVISMESAVYMIALLVGTEMVLIFNRRRGIRNV
ncbi:hypothetical protein M4D81_26955 [Paenibacillus sp. p3-SID867]|uniref:hypothetical protein n=1 Tax=Paenibacillus sp. p3-SID867 TaxID=2916363 RepID=UPI0021A429BA|nr:hypothetical protein [Paenibacillus sp. p3-SID867]MCT1402634.1 hypothetical protein [Paenibacillus sp. p3-SID867]